MKIEGRKAIAKYDNEDGAHIEELVVIQSAHLFMDPRGEVDTYVVCIVENRIKTYHADLLILLPESDR